MSKEKLLTHIEKKRAELIAAATHHGLSSNIALKISQDLDTLLNEYDKQYLKKPLSTAANSLAFR
ncbi:Spo0E family sporulation regulatory protein-aspartic acid phosphatase [Peribacillus sp. SCS-37]|uniref:Spo0E family sporulation regulatory protein-aspartic acid phosphatase n=1 Tax=Paraperibacillus esterisolvens TaxID=3115296 RepID=UPI003905E41A